MGQTALELVQRLFGAGGRLAHLGQAMEVKLVGISLAMDLGHDVLVIVVAQGSAQLVVVHVGFAFPLSPTSGDLVGIGQLEFPVGAFPGNTVGVGVIRQEL